MNEERINNAAEAMAILKDSSYQEFRREEAVTYLRDHPTAENIAAIVEGLKDDDYGVHWACGTAVARLGEVAFHTYLLALAAPNHHPRLREIARHIINTNSSAKVKEDGAGLLKAAKGPAAAIATIEEANRLLLVYR